MDIARALKPGDGESVAIPGFGATIKLQSKDGGAVGIVEHPFAVGTITVPHRHSREDEHSFVLEGEIGFRSDDTEAVLGPGGFISKPRGQLHAMWNATDRPGRILEVIAPGGFENYFRELGELLGSVTPPAGTTLRETPEFADLASRYGLSYGNPAWLDDIVARYGLTPPNR
jgi:quercetin dioxygenase-like cupin family protein